MNTLNQLPWAEQKKITAWTRCHPIQGQPLEYARLDDYGHVIRWADHGSQSEYGWEVDHVVALALGGLDSLDNVRGLHWRKNRELGGHVGNALNVFRQDAEKPMTQPRGMFGKRGFGF